jgi:hypothetical protein
VSATITTTFGRSIFSPLLLSLSTRFVNNRERDSRTGLAARQERLGRNFKRFEDFFTEFGQLSRPEP